MTLPSTEKRMVFLIVFIGSLLAGSCNPIDDKATSENHRLAKFENDQLICKVLPDVGGRVVYFGLKERGNIFKADTLLWAEPSDSKPSMKEVKEYKPYHGHVVWLGPMSEWWNKQTLYPEKFDDRWPPDPFLDYGSHHYYQSNDTLYMQGPESPITGVQITKKLSYAADNRLRFFAEVTNVRDSSIGWDIWMNTRLPADSRCYIPVSNINNIWFKSQFNELYDTLAYGILDGYFTFFPPDSLKRPFHTSKAFIYPDRPYMVAFTKNQCFVIVFPFHSRSSIHPEQALVEVFNQYSEKESENLLELEYHSAYKIIQPGQKISTFEDWMAFPYNGPNKVESHLQFIQSIKSEIVN